MVLLGRQMDWNNADKLIEPLVDVRSAAQFLRMAELTVRRKARAGQLPAIAFEHPSGRHTYRFRMSELDAYVNGLRKPTQESTVYSETSTAHRENCAGAER